MRSLLIIFALVSALGVQIENWSTGEFKINHKMTNLTIGTVSVGREDVIEFDDKSYSIGPTWTFFRLSSRRQYTVTSYYLDGRCNSSPQRCYQECPAYWFSKDCHETIVNSDKATGYFFYVLGQKVRNLVPFIKKDDIEGLYFCWGLRLKGRDPYTSFALEKLATISLIDYGGPDVNFNGIGFTMSDSIDPTDYNFSLAITGSTPDTKSPLSDFRYLEHLKNIVYTDLLHQFDNNSIPDYAIDWDKTRCTITNDIPTLDLHYNFTNKDLNATYPFSSMKTYYIWKSKESRYATLSTLEGMEILGTRGISPWLNVKEFDYLDVCNQQFLTLKLNELGEYYVIAPPKQRLKTDNDTICVAVRLGKKDQDLFLYELQNSSKTWTRSERFEGMVSPDYIAYMSVRITTKSSITLGVKEAKVDIKFVNVENASFALQMTTDIPLKCEVKLSHNCSATITTTDQKLTMRHEFVNCGALNFNCFYHCDGVFGEFYPPYKLTLKNVSDFYNETVVASRGYSLPIQENFGTLHPVPKHEIPFLTYLFVLLAIIGCVAVCACAGLFKECCKPIAECCKTINSLVRECISCLPSFSSPKYADLEKEDDEEEKDEENSVVRNN